MAEITEARVGLNLNDGEFPEICREWSSSVSVTPAELEEALRALGKMDGRDANFLLKLAQARMEDVDVFERLMEVREKVLGRERISGPEFVLLTQRLQLMRLPSLDIHGARFGSTLNLNGMEVAGNFKANNIVVDGDLLMNESIVRGYNDQDDAVVGGDFVQNQMLIVGSNFQGGAKVVNGLHQRCTVVGGLNIQNSARVGGDLDQELMFVGDANFQNSMRVGGYKLQDGMRVGDGNWQVGVTVGRRNSQRNMLVGKKSDQSYSEAGGGNDFLGMKVRGNLVEEPQFVGEQIGGGGEREGVAEVAGETVAAKGPARGRTGRLIRRA